MPASTISIDNSTYISVPGELTNGIPTSNIITTTDPIIPSVFAPFALPMGGNKYHEGSHGGRHPRDPLSPPPFKPF